MKTNELRATQKFNCPYCHAVSAFDCLFSVRGVFQSRYYPISVWACHNCDRAIFVREEDTPHENIAHSRFSIALILPATEPKVDSRVPNGIAADFIEAARDYNIASYKSSAVMARRTIQKMCINLGATKEKHLFEQIEELKNNGKLHSDLADIATEIRFLGNNGAHPENDGLDEVDATDAKEILDFTAELLDDLYVRPEKVAAMKKRRETKSTP